MEIVNTSYDDVFRTLLNDCTSLIIPVINEVFKEKYSGEEKERITDTYFMICGKEKKKYHLECQSTADNSMIVRMFEYDTHNI